jgi:hypothetical protein
VTAAAAQVTACSRFFCQEVAEVRARVAPALDRNRIMLSDGYAGMPLQTIPYHQGIFQEIGQIRVLSEEQIFDLSHLLLTTCSHLVQGTRTFGAGLEAFLGCMQVGPLRE